MRKLLLLLLCCALAACQPTQVKPVSLHDKVIAAGKIRCGYFDWEPLLKKDVNTGQFSGIGADVMDEISQRLGITHEWVEELGPATAAESIRQGRIDMMCVPMTITMPRVRVVDFSEPLFFGRFITWVRADAVFTDTAQLNNPAHKFVYMDGTPAMGMTKKLFPNAGTVSIGESSPMSDLFSNVAGGKADAVIADISNAQSFIRSNPGKIKPLFDADTDRVIPWAFMTPPDEYQFTHMIDMVLSDMQLDGTLAKIVAKHDAQDFYLPVTPNYIKQ